MENIYLTIAIAVANIIAIAITYQIIKKMPKRNKIIFLAISVAIMYILVSIVYWISGFGIDAKIHSALKNFVTYLFVPINVVLFVPYFALQYKKFIHKQLKVEQFSKKLSILVTILIVVLVVEYFYFVNIQKNVKNIQENAQQTQSNEIQSNEVQNNETKNNEEQTSENQNSVVQNTEVKDDKKQNVEAQNTNSQKVNTSSSQS
jgi:hypothetical protein